MMKFDDLKKYDLSYDIRFIIKMEETDFTDGMFFTREMLLLYDELEERFPRKDYIDMMCGTMIFHQFVEQMMNNMFTLLDRYNEMKRFPDIPKRISTKKIRMNGKRKNSLQEKTFHEKFTELDSIWDKVELDGDTRDKITYFVKNARKLNDIRNRLAHAALEYTPEDLVLRMNEVNALYKKCYGSYVEIHHVIYNYIKDEIHENWKHYYDIGRTIYAKEREDNVSGLAKYILNVIEKDKLSGYEVPPVYFWAYIELVNDMDSSNKINFTEKTFGYARYDIISNDEMIKSLCLKDYIKHGTEVK